VGEKLWWARARGGAPVEPRMGGRGGDRFVVWIGNRRSVTTRGGPGGRAGAPEWEVFPWDLESRLCPLHGVRGRARSFRGGLQRGRYSGRFVSVEVVGAGRGPGGGGRGKDTGKAQPRDFFPLFFDTGGPKQPFAFPAM